MKIKLLATLIIVLALVSCGKVSADNNLKVGTKEYADYCLQEAKLYQRSGTYSIGMSNQAIATYLKLLCEREGVR